MTASARVLPLPLPRERAARTARIERLRQERDRAVREWGYWYGVARTLAERRDAAGHPAWWFTFGAIVGGLLVVVAGRLVG